MLSLIKNNFIEKSALKKIDKTFMFRYIDVCSKTSMPQCLCFRYLHPYPQCLNTVRDNVSCTYTCNISLLRRRKVNNHRKHQISVQKTNGILRYYVIILLNPCGVQSRVLKRRILKNSEAYLYPP